MQMEWRTGCCTPVSLDLQVSLCNQCSGGIDEISRRTERADIPGIPKRITRPIVLAGHLISLISKPSLVPSFRPSLESNLSRRAARHVSTHKQQLNADLLAFLGA
jgi:hypothetical protein